MTASFRCSASFDNRPLVYQWQKDRENLNTDSSSRFSINADGTLSITNTKLDDRGEYRCFVKRQGKKRILGRSNSVFLSVKGKRNAHL